MGAKSVIRNIFGTILVIIGFLLSIIGGIYAQKESAFIPLIIGLILFGLGIVLASYQKKTKISFSAFLVVILIISSIVGKFTPSELERREQEIANADKWKEQDNGTMAFVMANQRIKEQLKSPSTAKFPSITTKGVAVVKQEFTYTVTGYVDSQNSFGAVVRTRYQVIIEQVSKDDWRVKDISILE